MTFNEFAYGFFSLPARAWSGFVKLLLGSYQLDNNGRIKKDAEGNPKTNPGLFSLLMDGLQLVIDKIFDTARYIGRTISDFVSSHIDTIATAFWISLAVGGAMALMVGLWPAALAAVTSFSIYGVSIASLVGSSFALQVAATGGIAAVASGAVVYVTSAVVHSVKALSAACSGKGKSTTEDNESDGDFDYEEEPNNSPRNMSALGGVAGPDVVEDSLEPPSQHSSPIRSGSPSLDGAETKEFSGALPPSPKPE